MTYLGFFTFYEPYLSLDPGTVAYISDIGGNYTRTLPTLADDK